MLYGLQTHFGYALGRDACKDIAAKGVQLCRVAAGSASVDLMREMVAEVTAAEMRALVIVDRADQLNDAPMGVDYEFGNEPDGDISPTLYRAKLNAACEVALQRGLPLWAPAISNLSEPALKWLNQVRDAGGGWPAGLKGISAHSYGPFPHPGFSSRDSEVRWLKVACVGLPFIISEWGLSTSGGVTDAQQKAFYEAEWAFWVRHGAEAAVAYQLNDGQGTGNEANFGIRRTDGSWKPSAETFPQQTEEEPMSLETYPESWLVPGETPGTQAIKKPNGNYVSVDPDTGKVLEQTYVGWWESGKRSGNELVYHWNKARAFALPLAVGL